MKSLLTSFRKDGTLHHAYVIEGVHENVYPNLCLFCENDLKFQTKANPDFYHEVFDRFSIADARRLHDMQMRKTTDRGRKIFIISFTFITKEAQNALLKVLEEPTKGTHFFFITTSTKRLLDTVLSRVVCIGSGEVETKTEGSAESKKFLSMSFKERMNFATKFASDIKDEKKSRGDALYFVQGIENLLHEKLKAKPSADLAKKLHEVGMAEKYIHDHGSSVKQLLEHIALMV